MSISKPFVFALVCEALGSDRARDTLGVNATGLPFNSVTAIEQSPDGRTNPMVNPGAIATTSLVPGESADAKWRLILEGLSRFAGPVARRSTPTCTRRPRRRISATRTSRACCRPTAESPATRPTRPISTRGSAA